jgi:hypothetical protein
VVTTVTGVPKLVAVQVVASDNAVIAYVPAAAPIKVKVVLGWFVTVMGVVPSLYVNVKGAVPVKVNVTSGWVAPEQTVPPPEMAAVGRGFTVITADPVILAFGAVTLHVVAVFVTLTMV